MNTESTPKSLIQHNERNVQKQPSTKLKMHKQRKKADKDVGGARMQHDAPSAPAAVSPNPQEGRRGAKNQRSRRMEQHATSTQSPLNAAAPPGFGPPPGEFNQGSASRRTGEAQSPKDLDGDDRTHTYPIEWLWNFRERPGMENPVVALPTELDRKASPGSMRAARTLEIEFMRRISNSFGANNRSSRNEETPEWFGRDDDLKKEYKFKVLDNDDRAHWAKFGTVKNDVSVLSLRDYEEKERRLKDPEPLFDQPFDSNDILEAFRKDREAKQPGLMADQVRNDFMAELRAAESRKSSSRRMDVDYRLSSVNGTDPSTLAYASRTATQLMKQQLSLLGYSFVPTQSMRLQESGLSPDERDRLMWEESQRNKYIQAIAEASLMQEQRNQAALRKMKRHREKQREAQLMY